MPAARPSPKSPFPHFIPCLTVVASCSSASCDVALPNRQIQSPHPLFPHSRVHMLHTYHSMQISTSSSNASHPTGFTNFMYQNVPGPAYINFTGALKYILRPLPSVVVREGDGGGVG